MAEKVLPKPKRGIYRIGKCVELYRKECRLERDKTVRIQREREQCQRDLDAGRPLRMSIELAAEEFGIPEQRLRKAFRQVGLL